MKVSKSYSISKIEISSVIGLRYIGHNYYKSDNICNLHFTGICKDVNIYITNVQLTSKKILLLQATFGLLLSQFQEVVISILTSSGSDLQTRISIGADSVICHPEHETPRQAFWWRSMSESGIAFLRRTSFFSTQEFRGHENFQIQKVTYRTSGS